MGDVKVCLFATTTLELGPSTPEREIQHNNSPMRSTDRMTLRFSLGQRVLDPKIPSRRKTYLPPALRKFAAGVRGVGRRGMGVRGMGRRGAEGCVGQPVGCRPPVDKSRR